MPNAHTLSNSSEIRHHALSRWENEGGAPDEAAPLPYQNVPDMTNAELVHLRVRVIALENLMIAVLAKGSDEQIAAAREMAAYISPRPDATHHPLTIQAAHHMTDMADRAIHFRTVAPL